MQNVIVGVDVGGTKIAAGLVDVEKGELSSRGVHTRKTFDFSADKGLFEQITETIDFVMQSHGLTSQNIAGIGLCVPSPVDPTTGYMYNPPNLRGWANIPLKTQLAAIYPVAIAVDNDANAAALAETRWGAAKGFGKSVIYVTVSTGVGTGIVINHAILHGKNGLAGEGGHVPIDGLGEVRCGCGNIGCIEVLASGRATALHAIQRLRQEKVATSLVNGVLEEIDMVRIGEAAAQGDAFAKEIVTEQARRIGIWLGGMVAIFDPEIVVIGGGCANLGDAWFHTITKTMIARTINPLAQGIPVVPATLGLLSGVLGAASLI